MFDFVRRHNRLLQIALVLLIFPSFVFFGIQGYSRFVGPDNETVAKVAGRKITRAEWDAANRDQLERVRRQMPNVDIKLFDTPQMRRQTLDALVRERVMLAAADELHLVTTDDRLQRLFASDPQFAFLRKPDGSLNQDVLAAQGMNSEMLVQRLRQDISMRQVTSAIAGSAFAPVTATGSAIDSLLQQREVQLQRFETKDYVGKVTPTDAQIEAYYKNPLHEAEFKAPEQASIEYVVLDLDALKKGVNVSEDELRKYYAENESRFTSAEERRASHVLVKAEKSAPAADRAKAKAKAESLLAEIRKTPSSFADVARKNSDDPGSAERGGDLDFFGRGAMVKPFEDSVFAMKQGEISGVVESDFGYHIIQLTGVRGGEKRGFDAVRAEIDDEVRKQLAQRRFAEAAVDFTNVVYEQSDSLKPAVDKFKLELKRADKVIRVPDAQASGALASPKFMEALFAGDALRNKRNTEAVEIGPNQMVSGRVLQYSPAHQKPLAEVRQAVHDKVAAEQAAALARKEGEARLAQLRSAPDTPMADAPLVLSRAQMREQPRQVVDAVLRAPAGKLPAFIGVDLGNDGYAVAKLSKVLPRDPAVIDTPRAQAQYAQTWADAETQAYFAALKSRLRADVTASAAAAASSPAN